MFLVLLAWIIPQVNVFEVSFLFNVEKMNNTKIPSIALRDLTDNYDQQFDPHDLSDSQTVNNLLQFEIFTKLKIFFYTLSSFMSFWLFMLAIIRTYLWPRKKNERGGFRPLILIHFAQMREKLLPNCNGHNHFILSLFG